jgi:hypothetical protein
MVYRALPPEYELNAVETEYQRPLRQERSRDVLLGDELVKTGAHYRSSESIPKNIFLAIGVITFFAITTFTVSIWVITYTKSHDKGNYTGAVIIGGAFSVTAAKLIDVVVSILVAPAILALANYYIFKLVRATAINERSHGKRSVSVEALIEVSVTNWGSYHPGKHWTLSRTGDLRLSLVACVAILSAISFSFMSNVVAYEAVDYAIIYQNLNLEHLYVDSHSILDPSSGTVLSSGADNLTSPLPDMIDEQYAKFKGDMFGALAPLGDTVEKLLNNHTSILFNVSDSSLDQVPSTVHRLYDVPAVRMSYACEPSKIRNVTFELTGIDSIQISITAFGDQGQDIRTYNGTVQHNLDNVLEGRHYLKARRSIPQPFIAFSQQYVWLGMFFTNNSGSSPGDLLSVPSPWGNVSYFVHNNTNFVENELRSTQLSDEIMNDNYNDMLILKFFGVVCNLWREEGTTNLTRISSNQAGLNDWRSVSDPYFPSDHRDDKKTPFNTIDMDFQSPLFSGLQFSSLSSGASSPDIGFCPGLAATLTNSATSWLGESGDQGPNFQNFADAYLYAEAKTRSVTYQLLQSGPGQLSNRTFNVQAQGQGVQRYAITYVPWILMTGLLALGMACFIALYLVGSAWRSRALRRERILNTLRMTMDLGTVVEKELFERGLVMSKRELDRWAEKAKVRYTVDRGDREENDSNIDRGGFIRLEKIE